MASISSATTLTLNAFITEKGRKYLFGTDAQGRSLRMNGSTDLFKPTRFSVYDSDVHYAATKLESGDLTSLAGDKGNTCLSTTADQERKYGVQLGLGLKAGMSFDQAMYEINEGDSVTIRVSISHFFFNFDPRRAVLVIDQAGTDLLDNEYGVSVNNGTVLSFEDGNQEIEFTVKSTTFQKILQGSSKMVKFRLTTFDNAVPGDIIETTVKVNGTATENLTMEFQQSSQSVQTPQSFDNTVTVETYITLNKPTQVSSNRGSVQMRLSSNILDVSSISVEIFNSESSGNPGTGTRRGLLEANKLSLPFSVGHDRIKIIATISNMPSLATGEQASLTFTLSDPVNNTALGAKDQFVLTLVGSEQLGSCDPATIVDGEFIFGITRWESAVNYLTPPWDNAGSNVTYAAKVYEDWDFVSADGSGQLPGVNNISCVMGPILGPDYDKSNLPAGTELADFIKSKIAQGLTVTNTSGFYSKILYQQINKISGSYVASIRMFNLAQSTENPNLDDMPFDGRVYVVGGKTPNTMTVLGSMDLVDTAASNINDSLGYDPTRFNTYDIPINLDDTEYIGFFTTGINGEQNVSYISIGTSTIPIALPTSIQSVVDYFRVVCSDDDEVELIEVCEDVVIQEARPAEYRCVRSVFLTVPNIREPDVIYSSENDESNFERIGGVEITTSCTLVKAAVPEIKERRCRMVPK